MEKEKYITKFLSSVGVSTDISRELKDEIFQGISRKEEAENRIKDGWGNWEWPYCQSHLDGKLYTPWLDTNLKLNGKSIWPGGKKFALVLTHDVDDISYMTPRKAFRQLLQHLRCKPKCVKTAMRDIRDLFSRPNDNIELQKWMEIEDSFGFHSTFFFLPDKIEKPHLYDPVYRYGDEMPFDGRQISLKEAMQKIDQMGWGVGLHGSYYSATTPGLLKEQKTQLEAALGKEVISTRQHWLHYDINVTPVLQSEAGFKVDSTQGFNRSVGFRAGTAFPYFCFDHKSGKSLPILEVPLNIMDSALFNPNALEYNAEFAQKHCLKFLDIVESVGGCLTLNFHPNYLSDERFISTYKFILQEAHIRGAWGCSIEELYHFWINR